MEATNDEDRTRARTFFQVVLDDLFALSSPEFQSSVWIRGDHPQGYVHDYVEAVEMLRDFAGWLLDDDYWKHVPLTRAQALALKEVHDAVMDFDDRLSQRDSQIAISDPAWPAIVMSAGSALWVLCEGSQALRPQVGLT